MNIFSSKGVAIFILQASKHSPLNSVFVVEHKTCFKELDDFFYMAFYENF